MIKKVQGSLIWKIKRRCPGILLSLLIFISNIQVFAIGLQDKILPSSTNSSVQTSVQVTTVNQLFIFAKTSIFALLWLVVVAVFIFIGARLVIARWNPEEFKKVLLQFVYAVVWLFVVSIAYLAVQLVSSLSIN